MSYDETHTHPSSKGTFLWIKTILDARFRMLDKNRCKIGGAFIWHQASGISSRQVMSSAALYYAGWTGTRRSMTESLGTLHIEETSLGSNPRQRASN